MANTTFSAYEDEPIRLHEEIGSLVDQWSDEDKKNILIIDGYRYAVVEESEHEGRKVYIAFCLGPKEATAAEKEDLGYATFTFDRCYHDNGGFSFDAREVVLSPSENLVIADMFASLTALKQTFYTQIIAKAF